jgi:hypothetical protein
MHTLANIVSSPHARGQLLMTENALCARNVEYGRRLARNGLSVVHKENNIRALVSRVLK